MPELVLPKRRNIPLPGTLRGEWKQLYVDTVSALLDRYAQRGPQYEMLCDLAAGLYVQVRRMEATGAIRGLETLDQLIAKQLVMDVESDEAVAAAQAELANAEAAMKVYLQAMDQLRKLIGQAQLYTEARRQEIIVTEVNSAVVETLRIVETFVEPNTFLKIMLAVRAALEGKAA